MNDYEIEILIDNQTPTPEQAEELLKYLGKNGVGIKPGTPRLRHFSWEFSKKSAEEQGY